MSSQESSRRGARYKSSCTRNSHCNLRHEKIEVAAAVCLLHRFEKKLAIAACIFFSSFACAPFLPAFGELGFIDEQLEAASGNIECDSVAATHQRKRTTERG